MDKHNPEEQLTVAFGKRRAKEILRDINILKEKNPGKAFSFIFAEDGSFQYVEKQKEDQKEEDDDDQKN